MGRFFCINKLEKVMDNIKNKKNQNWKDQIHEIIFEADTKAGKVFDLILMILIVLSVIVVMLDSIESVRIDTRKILLTAEWVFTLIFTLEYILRIISVKKSFKYIFSFYGVVDFLSIIPTYISLVFTGTQFLLVIRVLRLLRVFRVLKLVRFTKASRLLQVSIKESMHKITIFLGVVITSVIIAGAMMYLIEGHQNDFTSIPKSIYWAIVTLTTVGYGDMAPSTVLGQTLASLIMILGYSIIAVPTGIITIEMAKADKKISNTQSCNNCNLNMHDNDAKYCKICGTQL